MTSAAALFVVAACVVLAGWFRVPALARAVIEQSRRGLHDLRDRALDERTKERAIQAHARRLLQLFVVVAFAAVAAVALPLGLLALLDRLGLVAFGAVVERTLSPWFLLVVLPLGFVIARFLRRRRA